MIHHIAGILFSMRLILDLAVDDDDFRTLISVSPSVLKALPEKFVNLLNIQLFFRLQSIIHHGFR